MKGQTIRHIKYINVSCYRFVIKMLSMSTVSTEISISILLLQHRMLVCSGLRIKRRSLLEEIKKVPKVPWPPLLSYFNGQQNHQCGKVFDRRPQCTHFPLKEMETKTKDSKRFLLHQRSS